MASKTQREVSLLTPGQTQAVCTRDEGIKYIITIGDRQTDRHRHAHLFLGHVQQLRQEHSG